MSGFTPANSRHGRHNSTTSRSASVIAALTCILLSSSAVSAAPGIRTTDVNRVPSCASPERLTAFLVNRNPTLDPKFRDIARWYKHWGDAWRVRWDYAFFQMVIETNALKFRRGDGRRGDVNEKQNNFAGIGATGGGVPGDRFPDIKTGVHAQIQHLVAYSGERLADPIAPRTQEQQDGIIDKSRRLRRPVTFGDLARRWAADRAYSRTIDAVAEQFRSAHCTGVAADAAPLTSPPAPKPALRKSLAAFAPPFRLGGPKPSKLAGPEDLPWTPAETLPTQTAPAPARDDVQLIEPQKQTPQRLSPTRTIWSRDGNPLAADAPTQNAERAESVINPAPIVVAPVTDDTPTLPHFRIAPSMPAPSRLGGPTEAIAIVPEAPAASSARFKDIVLAPPVEPSSRANIPSNCKVLAASYGGQKTLLVRATSGGETRYTALTVLDGFEKSMFDTYTKVSAPGAEIIGEYPTKADALADARANCSND